MRRQWQRPCQALQRGDGVSQQRPKGWPVSFHGVVAPLVKVMNLPFGVRLGFSIMRRSTSYIHVVVAMKTDRLTETDTLNWLMY